MSTSSPTPQGSWINVSATQPRVKDTPHILNFTIDPLPLDKDDPNKIRSVKLETWKIHVKDGDMVEVYILIQGIGFAFPHTSGRTKSQQHTVGSTAQTQLGSITVLPHPTAPHPTASLSLSVTLYQDDRVLQFFQIPWIWVEMVYAEGIKGSSKWRKTSGSSTTFGDHFPRSSHRHRYGSIESPPTRTSENSDTGYGGGYGGYGGGYTAGTSGGYGGGYGGAYIGGSSEGYGSSSEGSSEAYSEGYGEETTQGRGRHTLGAHDLVAADDRLRNVARIQHKLWSASSESSPRPTPASAPPIAEPSMPKGSRHVVMDLSPIPTATTSDSFDRPYNLTFDVADVVTPQMLAVELTPSGFTAKDQSPVTFRILLETKDFKVGDPVQDLIVGPTGPGVLPAVFDVTPRHLGLSKIRAILYREARWLQRILLDVNVEQSTATITHFSTNFLLPTTTTPGPPPAMSINVYRGEESDDSYRCIISERRQMKPFRLALSNREMGMEVTAARTALLDVVQCTDETGSRVFQKDIKIPKKDADFALATLAEAGLLMFNKVFKANTNDREADSRTEEMRKTLTTEGKTYVVQIVSGDAPLPWGLLYLGTTLDDPSWELFLGMRHIVELGLEEAPIPPTNIIARSDKLKVSLNFNPLLDVSLGIKPSHECSVTQQKAWWNNARLADFTQYRFNETILDVIDSLKRLDDHIIFFYCHGHSDDGDPWLSLTGLEQDRLYLKKLIPHAPTVKQFLTSPLVVINACQSAGRTTHFFDGFVPYFLKKGALGLIGTECNIPAIFAVDFVEELFEELFHGETVGSAMLKLRKRYLESYNNPLGLLYASYCEAETKIDPSFFPSDSG